MIAQRTQVQALQATTLPPLQAPCDAGYTYSSGLGYCVRNTALHNCLANEFWDGTKCSSAFPQCAAGQSFNRDTGQCTGGDTKNIPQLPGTYVPNRADTEKCGDGGKYYYDGGQCKLRPYEYVYPQYTTDFPANAVMGPDGGYYIKNPPVPPNDYRCTIGFKYDSSLKMCTPI